MKRFSVLRVAMIAAAAIVAFWVPGLGHADEEASPIYGITLPQGYRDWKLISVTHEEGAFDQLRAQLGNDIAIKAYREGKRHGLGPDVEATVKTLTGVLHAVTAAAAGSE